MIIIIMIIYLLTIIIIAVAVAVSMTVMMITFTSEQTLFIPINVDFIPRIASPSRAQPSYNQISQSPQHLTSLTARLPITHVS